MIIVVPISSLVTLLDEQGVWFLLLCGQLGVASVYFVTALFSSVGLFSWILPDFESINAWNYSLLFAAAAYGIVLWRMVGRPRLEHAYWRVLITSENLSYFLLALVFSLYYSAPQLPILVPFTIYSLFHISSFTREKLLLHPYMRYQLRKPTIDWISTQLNAFEKRNQNRMLRQIALFEVVAFPLIFSTWLFSLVRSIIFSASNKNGIGLMGLIVYAQFLRHRYALSANTRSAWVAVGESMDTLIQHKYVPASIGLRYKGLRTWLVRWSQQDQLIQGLMQMQQQRPPTNN